MQRRTILVAFIAFATTLSLVLPAAAASPPSDNDSISVPHADTDGNGISQALEARLERAGQGEKVEVIVTWDARPDVARARAAAGPFAVLQEFSIIDGFSALMTAGQVRALSGVAGVSRIDENFEVLATNYETDIEFGTEQARADFSVDGTGVDVCVLDTGADPNHEQLDSSIVAFDDQINGQSQAYDDQGHGTHVAATIAGDGVGGSALAAQNQGIAPGASLYISKVLGANGSGTATQIINGIQWCINMGVDVMSMSLGTATGSDGNDALSQAVNNAVQTGIVATVAAGNSGDAPESVGSPGAAPLALTVGAVGKMSDGLILAPFSSRGPNLAGALKPEISAPGVLTVSADAGTTAGYVAGTGTSMATPFAAGAVALLLDADPNLSPAQVKNLVTSTARDIGAAGADNDSGFGLIDGYALVAAGLGNTATGAMPTHTQISGTVPNNGIWSHQIVIQGDDIGQPIGVTVLIEGSMECSFWFFGFCFAYEWSPDLDARLITPNGTMIDSRCPLEGWCGNAGVEESFRVGAALEGIYTLEVYPFDGQPNNGKGGSFLVDLFTGSYDSSNPPANQPPVADAGPDQTVPDTDDAPGETVILDGSESFDPDGSIVSWVWTDSGNNEIATGANPAGVSFDDGIHTVTLTVTDDNDATAEDEVVVTVEAPVANEPPVADAGPDQTVPDTDDAPGETVTLDGSESFDPDGSIVSWVWTDSGNNEIATGAKPAGVSFDDGIHTVTLTVTDDNGATDSDVVVITVESAPPPPGTVHVHDLDDVSQKLSKGAWKAVVNVSVRDSAEASVGFTVTGVFTQNGWNQTQSCTDGDSGDVDGLLNGVCQMDAGQMPSKNGQARFTVTDVRVPGHAYSSGANHDPDGDSDGTSIALSK